jgi:U3 small nucleolar RNA-associated protein 23
LTPVQQVILDGTFIKAALEHQMQIKDMVEKIVQGDVILMSTNCVRKELKFLGVTCNRALSFANRQCDTANCHDRPIVAPPSKCISTIIGATNPGRFLVCTLDEGLLKLVEAVPGVPCLTISYAKMSMRSPSAASLAAVSSRNAGLRAPVTPEERKLLVSAKEENGIKKKKKKIKGPNPLSVKRPAKASSQLSSTLSLDAAPAEAPKRKARRKPKDKKKKQGCGDDGDGVAAADES